MMALYAGFFEGACELLRIGADLHIKDAEGGSAIEMILQAGYCAPLIRRLLEEGLVAPVKEILTAFEPSQKVNGGSVSARIALESIRSEVRS